MEFDLLNLTEYTLLHDLRNVKPFWLNPHANVGFKYFKSNANGECA